MPIERTAQKSPDNTDPNDSDQSWMRRFWLSLGVLALISAAVAFYYTRDTSPKEKESVYVSLQVKPQNDSGQLFVCKLSLVVGREQEGDIRNHQKMLETVVSATLVKIYQQERRPKLSDVRQGLLAAINRSLPKKLQVEDLLVQELLAGLR